MRAQREKVERNSQVYIRFENGTRIGDGGWGYAMITKYENKSFSEPGK